MAVSQLSLGAPSRPTDTSLDVAACTLVSAVLVQRSDMLEQTIALSYGYPVHDGANGENSSTSNSGRFNLTPVSIARSLMDELRDAMPDHMKITGRDDAPMFSESMQVRGGKRT